MQSLLSKLEGTECQSSDAGNSFIYNALEIKPFGFGSRIQDMEAEWRLIKLLGESLVSRTGAEG